MQKNSICGSKQTLIYDSENAYSQGLRLDVFLLSHFPDYSRSYFQRLIEIGNITVNGLAVQKKSYHLKHRDAICIDFEPLQEHAVTPCEAPFTLVEVHDDFLIIDKPAGLVVHNTHSNPDEPSLVRALMHRFKDFNGFDDEERQGIVHRLDKDTSGLMVVARTVPAQIEFSRLFKERLVSKTYLAVVKGHPLPQGAITYPIGRHPQQRHKMSHQGLAARSARTDYEVLVSYRDCSLVAAYPVTGRTHQIRVHFAALGHGLLGDATYGSLSPFIARQALHAWQLKFTYKGKEFSYHASIPADFAALVKEVYAEAQLHQARKKAGFLKVYDTLKKEE